METVNYFLGAEVTREERVARVAMAERLVAFWKDVVQWADTNHPMGKGGPDGGRLLANEVCLRLLDALADILEIRRGDATHRTTLQVMAGLAAMNYDERMVALSGAFASMSARRSETYDRDNSRGVAQLLMLAHPEPAPV